MIIIFFTLEPTIAHLIFKYIHSNILLICASMEILSLLLIHPVLYISDMFIVGRYPG